MKQLKFSVLLTAALIALCAFMTVRVAAQNNNMNSNMSGQTRQGMMKKHRMIKRHRMMKKRRMMKRHRMMKKPEMMKTPDIMKKSG